MEAFAVWDALTNDSKLFQSRRFQTLLIFHWIFNATVLPEASENEEN